MNNKGFTLVELLAVVVIIGVLAVTTVYISSNIINNNKANLRRVTESNIKQAALNYAIENNTEWYRLPGNETDQKLIVDVSTLKSQGFLNISDETKDIDDVSYSSDYCVVMFRNTTNYVITRKDLLKSNKEGEIQRPNGTIAYGPNDLCHPNDFICGNNVYDENEEIIGIRCDVDDNKEINLTDVSLIIQYVVNLIEGVPITADANNDGSINVGDSTYIIKYYSYITGHKINYNIWCGYAINEGILCDIDNDGDITQDDYNMLVSGQGVLETLNFDSLNPDQKKRADTDLNGILNSNDTAIIKNYIRDNGGN